MWLSSSQSGEKARTSDADHSARARCERVGGGRAAAAEVYLLMWLLIIRVVRFVVLTRLAGPFSSSEETPGNPVGAARTADTRPSPPHVRAPLSAAWAPLVDKTEESAERERASDERARAHAREKRTNAPIDF